MSRELYFPFRKPKTSHGLRTKHLLPSAVLLTAHCPWKDFEENQRALDKTPCWNKEKWQWLTGLNNARLKLHLRIKWQEKPGGNLTKIACCLRKEPRQTCHLFTQSTGFRLFASHIDRASWEKNDNTFSPINPTASTLLSGGWVNCPFLPFTLTNWPGSSATEVGQLGQGPTMGNASCFFSLLCLSGVQVTLS